MKDEFEWIRGITPSKIFQNTILKKGIGDDAAVIEGNSSFDEVVCVDSMVEEVHFSRKTMTPFHIGYKALASNISDIAAMGGVPLFYLVSIAIPEDWTEKELKEIYKGMESLAQRYNMDLIGGDTVSIKKHLVVTVTVLGRVKKGQYVLRESSRPGDIVFVVGNVGDSAYGLSLLLENGLNYNYTEEQLIMINAHQMPNPQVEAGKIIGELGARVALNDISDGLASEANEIAEASNVQLEIEYDQLPINKYIKKFPKKEQFKWTLYGGEDYQLIGTIEERYWTTLQKRFEEKELSITSIGLVKEGNPKVILQCDNETIILAKGGYNHFKK